LQPTINNPKPLNSEVSGSRGSIYDGQYYVAELTAKYAATVRAIDVYCPGRDVGSRRQGSGFRV